MRRTVAVLQSNYLPWKGYFDLMHDVDLFVFYDDVQFTKNDWRNRNRIKTHQGLHWLTVPVGARIHRLVCEVELHDARWQAQHWRTIRESYGRAPFFRRYAGFFESMYMERAWHNLAELNQHTIRAIATEMLGMRTEFADSRAFALESSGSNRLLALLKQVGARTYVSGPAARAYIDEKSFADAGIELRWKSYEGYPEYPQLHPPFEHHVSVIDTLFHLGPDAGGSIWGWRTGV